MNDAHAGFSRSWSRVRRWCLAGLGAALVVAGTASLRAQPEPGAHAAGGARWIRVVEENDGEIVKLQLVSREYRKEDGSGPSVFLTGAVHVADASFYQELQAYLDAKEVVLFEGVKPPGAGRLDHMALQGGDEQLVKATKRRIRFVATFVEKFRQDNAKYPATLDEMIAKADGRFAKLLEGCVQDAWGHPFVYALKPAAPVKEDQPAPPKPTKGSAAFELTSLGADGQPAGEGVDADLTFSQQPSIKRNEISQGEGIQRQLAAALRLKFQLDAMDETKPNWRNSDLSVDQVMDRLEASGADSEQLFSMIGGGSILDSVMGVVARFVGMSKTISTMLKLGMLDMLSSADELLAQMGGEMGKMMEVIISDRNQVVADDLARVLRDEPDVKSVGIIYGAGHLSDLEKRLTGEMGFKEAGEHWFTAITVNVNDAGMSAAKARETREMIRELLQRQIKTMKGGR